MTISKNEAGIPSDNSTTGTIEVLRDEKIIVNRYFEVLRRAQTRYDYYTDVQSLSIPFSAPIKNELDLAVKHRGVKLRVITDLASRESVALCKNVVDVAELRHLEGVKGNFGVSDTEYFAIANPSGPSSPQAVYSNMELDVKQQHHIFENLWTKAIPARQRIREIEDGLETYFTDVIYDPEETIQRYRSVVDSSKYELMLLLPSSAAFKRHQDVGVLDSLIKLSENSNMKVRILLPFKRAAQKQFENFLSIHRNINLHFMEDSVGATKATILIGDRRNAFVMELRDDTKDNLRDAIGLSIHSNSQASVQSYVSIYENLWNVNELYQNIKYTNRKLESSYKQLKLKEARQQELSSSLEQTNKELVNIGALLAKSNEELVKKEMELKKANEELKAVDKAKDEFISMVSHELTTPLVPIKSYAEMLLSTSIMGTELTERQKKAVLSIKRNAEKQQALVEDILDVYKLDMGKVNLQKKNVNVLYLFDQILSDMKQYIVGKQIQLMTDFRVSSNMLISCDPNRIEQVISNMIKNSIDFVPEKDGQVVLKVEQDQHPVVGENIGSNKYPTNELIFTIQDNGIGIVPEKAKSLFTKFYQIDTSPTRKHSGSGLGLVICKGIVEAHGGRLWLDDTYTKGAAFKFTLPISNTSSGDNSQV